MASINGVMGVQWLPEINVTPKAPPITTNISMQVECVNKPVEAIQRGYQGNVSAHQVFDKIPQNCSSDFHLYHHDYGGNVHNLGKLPYWSSYYSNPFPQPSYQPYQNPCNAYTSCPDSSNWHGYGSTQYPGCGNSYQHQNHSYSQLVGATQKACGPYQSSPLTQETRYFTGSEIYSGSYKNSSDCQTIGMATYVKPPTPTGSKEFLVMQKQKEEPLDIEKLHGGEIVRVELQELGKGHMGTNEGFANKNVNAGMLEESGFTGLVKAGVGIEEVKKTKDAQNLIPERSYDVNWKSGVRNGQEWLGINVIPETPNLMPNVGGCYKDKSEWAKVKYARDYIGKEEI
ncbi:Leukocyte receptor cluster member 8-like [Quillaja saponaria]|uniref:Leukocyte receptor cluster member 8-like n=1 Tax=Quillaja saponaria TaxID=32244 RepID=A0AAD7L4C0_QUISA|nr:Leukocyte receptor cluster member 8-like [Quillaja saponaria]